MPYQPNYPATVAEVLDPPVRFRATVIAAVQQFARLKPFRGTVEERKEKFIALHRDLCRIYGKQTSLTFGIIDGSDSGSSFYSPLADQITLIGKLSVVTYCTSSPTRWVETSEGRCDGASIFSEHAFHVHSHVA